MKASLARRSRKAIFDEEAVGSVVDRALGPPQGASQELPTGRTPGARPEPLHLRRPASLQVPGKLRDSEGGTEGHRACVLGGVTRVGKPSASAILAASVGLFSYHVNRRRRPVGGGRRRQR